MLKPFPQPTTAQLFSETAGASKALASFTTASANVWIARILASMASFATIIEIPTGCFGSGVGSLDSQVQLVHFAAGLTDGLRVVLFI
jgi:hypothetical protein